MKKVIVIGLILIGIVGAAFATNVQERDFEKNTSSNTFVIPAETLTTLNPNVAYFQWIVQNIRPTDNVWIGFDRNVTLNRGFEVKKRASGASGATPGGIMGDSGNTPIFAWSKLGTEVFTYFRTRAK